MCPARNFKIIGAESSLLMAYQFPGGCNEVSWDIVMLPHCMDVGKLNLYQLASGVGAALHLFQHVWTRIDPERDRIAPKICKYKIRYRYLSYR